MEQAGHVILWTTGGLPKPFGGLLPTVTCEASLTSKGWKETLHAEYTSPFLPTFASQQTYQWISMQSAEFEYLANNWQKVCNTGVTDQIYFLFWAPYSKWTADSSGHFSVYRKNWFWIWLDAIAVSSKPSCLFQPLTQLLKKQASTFPKEDKNFLSVLL